MRFARHETFYFREGWLTKGLRKIEHENMKDVFQRDDAMEQLGIGKNMVSSLRYWMQATGLTRETGSGKKQQYLTEQFGKIIYEYDRFIEDEFTLWLLHYKLATNKEMATTWYWFFNIFKHREFDEESFINELETYVKSQNQDIAIGSLKKDFDCLIGMYLSSNATKTCYNPEDNLGCPLQELGIIDILDAKKKRYCLTRRKVREMPRELFLFGILDYLRDRDNDKNISIDLLLQDEKSIGRVFNLGLSELIQILEMFQAEGLLHMTKTAGLNQVTLYTETTPEEIIIQYYQKKRVG